MSLLLCRPQLAVSNLISGLMRGRSPSVSVGPRQSTGATHLPMSGYGIPNHGYRASTQGTASFSGVSSTTANTRPHNDAAPLAWGRSGLPQRPPTSAGFAQQYSPQQPRGSDPMLAPRPYGHSSPAPLLVGAEHRVGYHRDFDMLYSSPNLGVSQSSLEGPEESFGHCPIAPRPGAPSGSASYYPNAAPPQRPDNSHNIPSASARALTNIVRHIGGPPSNTATSNGPQTAPRVAHLGPAPTQILSSVCQARGFNPEWFDEGSRPGKVRLSLVVDNVRIIGAQEYNDTASAKYALAKQALETVCRGWQDVRRLRVPLQSQGNPSSGSGNYKSKAPPSSSSGNSKSKASSSGKPEIGFSTKGKTSMSKKESSVKVKEEPKDRVMLPPPLPPSLPRRAGGSTVQSIPYTAPGTSAPASIIDQIRRLADDLATTRARDDTEVGRAFLEGMAVGRVISGSFRDSDRRSRSPSRRDYRNGNRRERSPIRRDRQTDRDRDNYGPGGSYRPLDSYRPSRGRNDRSPSRASGGAPNMELVVWSDRPQRAPSAGPSTNVDRRRPNAPGNRWDHSGYYKHYGYPDDDRSDGDASMDNLPY